MSYRRVDTRYWNDTFVSGIDPLAKLLFIYFMTNDHTNCSGIYELPLKIAAIETGIDRSMLEKMLPALEGRVTICDGWVVVKNFLKYQNTNSPTLKEGIKRELLKVPNFVFKGLTEPENRVYIQYIDGIDTVYIQPDLLKLKLKLRLKPKLKPQNAASPLATIVKKEGEPLPEWGPDDNLEAQN